MFKFICAVNTGLPFPIYSTRDPAVVQSILSDNFDNFEKGDLFKKRLTEMLGNGIFNADGERKSCKRC
jgi:hypothetical protein